MKRAIILAITVVLMLVCYRAVMAPKYWENRTRKESVAILKSITSTNDLPDAVGHWGVALYLTNGAWIAIRHVAEFEPDRELAIAYDSGGGFFESKVKFSGRLTYYPQSKLKPENGGPLVLTPECFMLERVESAATLEEARHRLQEAMGFVPLKW